MQEKKDYKITLQEVEWIDLKEPLPEQESEHIRKGIMEKIQKEQGEQERREKETEIETKIETKGMEERETEKKEKETHRKQHQGFPWRKWGMAAAAAILLVVFLSPSGVSFAGKFYHSLPIVEKISGLFQGKIKQDGYRMDVVIEKEEENKKETDEKEVNKKEINEKETNEKETGNQQYLMEKTKQNRNYVKITYPQIQDYKAREKDGWYYFSHDGGFSAGKDFEFELIAVDRPAETGLFVDDIADMEEETIAGHTVIYIERNGVSGSRYHYDTDYTKRMIILFEEEGYLIQLYAMAGVEKEELLAFSGEIALKECKKKQASGYITLSEYFRHNFDRKEEKKITTAITIREDQVVSVGETASRSGIEYEIRDVQVLDNISALWKENGRGFSDAMDIWGRRLEYADKKGNLKSYIRETVEMGDGITAPLERVIASEEVFQKLVFLEIRVKNTTKQEKEAQICPRICYLLPQEDGWIEEESNYDYHRPKIIENCQLDRTAQYFKEAEKGSGFSLKTLQPGEEKVYHIGYFVDEDLLSSMFLSLDGGVWTGEYNGTMMDIRQ